MTRLLVALLCFCASFVIAGMLTRVPLLPDRPNARSLHTRVTPRSGGLSFLIPFFITLCLYATLMNSWSPVVIAVAIGCAAFSLIGLVDDAVQLSATTRLILQLLMTGALCFSGNHVVSVFDIFTLKGGLALTFQILWIMVCINFFNFMDGMDGLAGFQAFIFFLFTSIALFSAGGALGTALLCLTASLAGFLMWNLRPATLFMGDSGSYFLGFLIGFIPFVWENYPDASRSFLLGESTGVLDFTSGAILFSPFLLDAGLTVLRRLLAGENIFVAHRSHLYQLLHRSGWKSSSVLLLFGGFNVCAALLVMLREYSRLRPDEFFAVCVLVFLTSSISYSYLVRRLEHENRVG